MEYPGNPIEEFRFDPESARQIASAIYAHNLSMHSCADIIEAAAPLCDALTPGGVVKLLVNMYSAFGIANGYSYGEDSK